MTDDTTHFCEMTVCDGPTSDVVVEAILNWYSWYGSPHIWISDKGSHFRSEVVSALCKRLKCQHRDSLSARDKQMMLNKKRERG